MADSNTKSPAVEEAPLSGTVFVSVGEDGLRALSRDGRSWTHFRQGRDGEIYGAVCFGHGRCVTTGRFGGENIFAATADGVSWQPSKYDAQYARYCRSLVFFQDRFLGIGTNFVVTSADGVAWDKERKMTEYKVQYGIDSVLRRFAVGDGRLVGVGAFGRTAVTTDGLEWKNGSDMKSVNTMIDVTYGNGIFVGGGMHGLRMRSTDGLVWTERVVGEEGEHINAMIWDGRQFVGIGLGATYLSPDGVKWERVPNVLAPTAAAFGGGTYIGSLWPGRMLLSRDGIHWEEVAKLPQHCLALAVGTLGAAS